MKYEQFIVNNFDVTGTSGDEFICHCPWHEDKGKPNLYINAAKGVYLCHACGARGHLSKLGDIEPNWQTGDIRDRMKKLQAPKKLQTFYGERWLAQYAFPHPYWEDVRGFSPDTIARFNLGYDPMANVCTIPIRDERGRIMGVVTRALDNSAPKYKYPAGVKIGKHLFGSWMIEGRAKVALVEGPLDAVACWDARVPALALYGARLTHDQYLLLRKLGVRHVVIFTDNDRAGITAQDQIHEMARKIRVSVAEYRPYWTAKDPGELTPQQRRKAYHSARGWHDRTIVVQ